MPACHSLFTPRTSTGCCAPLKTPLVLSVVLACVVCGTALKPEEFRTCQDTGFCRRQRTVSAAAGRRGGLGTDGGVTRVAEGSVHFDPSGSLLTAVLTRPSMDSRLALHVFTLLDSTVRARVFEDKYEGPDWRCQPPASSSSSPPPRGCQQEGKAEGGSGGISWHAPQVSRPLHERFDASEALVGHEDLVAREGRTDCTLLSSDDGAPTVFTVACPAAAQKSAAQAAYSVVITADPFELRLLTGSEQEGHEGGNQPPLLSLNGAGMLHYETYELPGSGWGVQNAARMRELGVDVGGLLEPEEHNGHSDLPARGQASVGLDVNFGAARHVYGIPERSGGYTLKVTRDHELKPLTEPYRMYNLDVFEYETDHAMPLYGSIPFLLAVDGSGGARGVLWLNPAETYVDVLGDREGLPRGAHWFSETGDIDVFLFGGPSSHQVLRQHTRYVGRPHLPPLFALGYHQSRWNYNDEQDVASIHSQFDQHDIPYDVLWLDIEHTDQKKYLTWDESAFPDPVAMQKSLAASGRKMVTIVDPHLLADPQGYHVYAQAEAQGLFVQNSTGDASYRGKCWPGPSSWLDYVNPAAAQFWAELFSITNYSGSTETLYVWNDMNEPSVFDGPEITMHKNALHHPQGLGGRAVEHRELHNMYGFLMTQATYAGQLKAKPGQRPFILSRSFFAGSQRHVAVWTGDNAAEWSHLAAVTPMLLSMSLAGLSFVGADIGGFQGNPEPELLVRWYEMAIYTPFCRSHAHTDTARREPWTLEPQLMQLVRRAVKRRYALLPYIYTQFAVAHRTGTPVLRPLWWEFPQEAWAYGVQGAFMLGEALAVVPVTAAGITRIVGKLPRGRWFDVSALFTGPWATPGTVFDSDGSRTVVLPAPLGSTPLLLREGSVVALKERPRRSTAQMEGDPVTLLIGVGGLAGRWGALGWLYSDDGATFSYRRDDQGRGGEYLSTTYQLRFLDGAAAERAASMGEWELTARTEGSSKGSEEGGAGAAWQGQPWAQVQLGKVTLLGLPRCPAAAVLTRHGTHAPEAHPQEDSAPPKSQEVVVMCKPQDDTTLFMVTLQMPPGTAAHAESAWSLRLS